METNRILVTGGAGFIGTNLVNELRVLRWTRYQNIFRLWNHSRIRFLIYSSSVKIIQRKISIHLELDHIMFQKYRNKWLWAYQPEYSGRCMFQSMF